MLGYTCHQRVFATQIQPMFPTVSLAAQAIAKFAAANGVLKELDISGNELGGEGGAAIRDAVSSNTALEHCAAALSGMTQSDVLAVQDTLHTRAEARARIRFTKPHK